MNKRGSILCIVDGMTDESFNLADYRNLSALAQQGACGTLVTVPPGFMAESYPCIATLLGVDAARLPPLARGWLEALGAGLTMEWGDLILRASWMRLDEDNCLAGVAEPPAELPPLPEGCEYHHLGGYKVILILRRAAALLPRIETCPPHASAGQPLSAVLPRGEARLAEIVEKTRREGRVLMPWGQSITCELPAFGYRAAAVGAALIVKGLAQAMGMDFYQESGFSGDTDTDLAAKTRLAVNLTRQYQLILLHINGADEAAHRRDAAAKRAFLARVDEIVTAELSRAAIPVLICGDHGASPLSGRHLANEQPFVLIGTARVGNLGSLCGNEAINLLMGEA